MTLILNSLFGADATYEHAITTKLGGILVNLRGPGGLHMADHGSN